MQFNNLPKKTPVIIGLSGGVDSSVSAFLLKQAGLEVEAVFMQNWSDNSGYTDDGNSRTTNNNNNHCTIAQDLQDAQKVCEKLKIPLHTVNFSQQYWDKVFTYFLNSYKAGYTPNPDILCNQEIKFKAFLEYAKNMGAEYIATGHYAQIQDNTHNFSLLKGNDPNKDQTYFLHKLNQYQLSQSLFPIGDLPKEQVRAIAKQQELITHNKKDSTGICFIGQKNFKEFLSTYLPAQPGKIITSAGDHIGQHEGIMYYTIGQRQGINIGGLKKYPQKPWYVANKDIKNNILIITQDINDPIFNHTSLASETIHWINKQPINQKPINQKPINQQSANNLSAKIRYRQSDQACSINLNNPAEPVISFETTQRAITPGQSIVLYNGNECLGGAEIKQAINNQIIK